MRPSLCLTGLPPSTRPAAMPLPSWHLPPQSPHDPDARSQAAPAAAVTFTCYEIITSMLLKAASTAGGPAAAAAAGEVPLEGPAAAVAAAAGELQSSSTGQRRRKEKSDR